MDFLDSSDGKGFGSMVTEEVGVCGRFVVEAAARRGWVIVLLEELDELEAKGETAFGLRGRRTGMMNYSSMRAKLGTIIARRHDDESEHTNVVC